MRLFLKYQLHIFLLILSLSSLAVADRQNGIAIRIIGKEDTQNCDTIYCGYGNPMDVLTYGPDADTIDLPQYGVSVLETALPPIPPTGYFDLRFIDSRTGSISVLDQGIKNNFHHATFIPYPDTFKVSFQSIDTIDQTHPFVVSWKLPTTWEENAIGHYLLVRIQYNDPDSGLKKIDMIENSSLTFTNDEIKSFLIITTILLVDDVIDENIPSSFTLHQNYPNPFNPTTMINYTIPVASIVTLKIYNSISEEVATLVNTKQEPGFKSVEWNANNLASGLYLYRLTTSTGFSSTKKMLLVR